MKFTTIERYVSSTMVDNRLKMVKYKEGLLSRIQISIASIMPKNFSKLAGASVVAVKDIKSRKHGYKN